MENAARHEIEPQLSPEAKIGFLVLAGLTIMLFAILILGDVDFRPHRQYRLVLGTVEGVSLKAPVKISGVDVGVVSDIELIQGKPLLLLNLNSDVVLYKNAKARIMSTGFIGTKYIALFRGNAEPGRSEADQRLSANDTIYGEDSLAFEDLMDRVTKGTDQLFGGKGDGAGMAETLQKIRTWTDKVYAITALERDTLIRIVRNIEDFSASAKSAAARLDAMLDNQEQNIRETLQAMEGTFRQTTLLLAKVQEGKGAAGALLYDEKVAQNLKQTVTNIRDASVEAQKTANLRTLPRAFWEIGVRQDFKAQVTRFDVGLRIEPRPGRYYYFAGKNLGNDQTIRHSDEDYERRNTITVLVGRDWTFAGGGFGVVKSRPGVHFDIRPWAESKLFLLNRLEFTGDAFDFTRDDFRKGRRFVHPNFEAGVNLHLNSYISLGARVEDIAETCDWTGQLRVHFSDRDIAYLLGFGKVAR